MQKLDEFWVIMGVGLAMFYTAWKMPWSVADCVCLYLALGALPHTISHQGSETDFRSPDLCVPTAPPPYFQALASLLLLPHWRFVVRQRSENNGNVYTNSSLFTPGTFSMQAARVCLQTIDAHASLTSTKSRRSSRPLRYQDFLRRDCPPTGNMGLCER